jgi:hypothetical protein
MSNKINERKVVFIMMFKLKGRGDSIWGMKDTT